MNKLSFYEQVGIVIPGAVFLFVTMFYLPELRNVLGKDGVNLGGLGVFVLIAYAMGHLLGAVGNLIEAAYWRTRGGDADKLGCRLEAAVIVAGADCLT